MSGITLPSGLHVPFLRQSLEDGRVRDVLAMDERDMQLRPIAERLARINRYAGASTTNISVAAHSLLVSRLLPPELAWAGLMHDATESFAIGDLHGPLKKLLPDYQAIEAAILAQLEGPLALQDVHHPAVHAADRRALEIECELFRGGPSTTSPEAPPCTVRERSLARVAILNPEDVVGAFMTCAELCAPGRVWEKYGSFADR